MLNDFVQDFFKIFRNTPQAILWYSPHAIWLKRNSLWGHYARMPVFYQQFKHGHVMGSQPVGTSKLSEVFMNIDLKFGRFF